MSNRVSTAAACVLLLASSAGAGTNASIHVVRSTPPPLSAYVEAGHTRSRVVDFRQRDPNDGEPATLRTSADVTYDNERLYVTFVCDEDPADLRAHLRRREDIRSDDQVVVWLDTFHDGRHAYVFYANPLGVQLDGLVTDGQEDDFSFDAVWDAEGRLTPTGFVVRLSIPFRSLRYPSGDPRTWGIALGRVVQSRAELSTWPHLTSKIASLVSQLATLDGLERLPQERIADVTPYATATAGRYLNRTAGMRASADARAGVDAKAVLGRDWTVDATVHPDFSQVESDEPQVLVNQRYEVYFPEKRPFFTERAGFFRTPEQVFFSRRLVDPLAGVRVTGITGGWTIGALAVEDGATRFAGDRGQAGSAVIRAQRGFGAGSSWGATASVLRTATGMDNRVVSFDTRAKLTPNWILTAQAIGSQTADRDGDRAGFALFGELRHAGRHLNYYSNYRDRSPDLSVPLGFITRVDMRQMKHVVGYRWHPARGPLVGVGPSLFAVANWDRAGVLQDASIDAPLWLDFTGPGSIAVGRTRASERYHGREFRRDATYLYASTDALGWLGLEGSISRGLGINYYPASGAPTAGDSLDASAGVGVRASSRLQVAHQFVISRLTRGTAAVYDDRYLRVKSSVQITRGWSVRAIADLHWLDVSSEYDGAPDRRVTIDLLATYLVHPGSALYVGYSDRYQDLSLDPDVRLPLRPNHQSLVARQVFVKVTRTLIF